MAKTFTLPFLKREKVAKDTYSFFFDRSKVQFDFLPGQYIRLILPHEENDSRGTSRFFTIASSPHEKDILMLTVKIYDSSFKRTLFALKKGYSAEFFGPMGKFILSEDKVEKVFLAGGIGITVFHSMLSYAHAKKLPISLTLLAAFSNTKEIIFQKKLEAIAKQNKSIKIIYSLERFSETLLKKHIQKINQPIYYIVGSPAMVAATKELLVSLHIDEEKIKFEDFTGY